MQNKQGKLILKVMAADIKKILENLFEFYDFKNQTIISVGAGGGQFIEYGHASKQVIAIDNDEEALSRLENSLQKSQLLEKFTLINSDFYLVNSKADVVMFEFCLHEMKNPEAAIHHALTMAPNILINDHWPNSEWAYIVDEKEKVINSWEAIKRFNFKKIQRYDTVQFFHNYEELFQKVKVQGKNSINRIIQYKDKKDFTIPMSYGFALI
jgi:predicted RNA methylase